MKTDKTISVVVPVYNTEQYFERCINSILGQSYPHLEIIVINDGSPGNIDQLAAAFQKDDKRIKYLCHEENRGLFCARVTGMAAATGEYVMFVDSDDYLSFDFCRSLLVRAEEKQADITIGKTVWWNNGQCTVYNLHDSCFQFDVLEGSAAAQAYFSQEASCYSWHTVWNKLYRKDLIDRCFPVFSQIHNHIIMTEDILFSSVFFYEAARVARVNEGAYFYCTNAEAATDTQKITSKKFLKNLRDMTAVFNAVDAFLKDRQAPASVLAHFSNARKHYARMWQNLLDRTFSGREAQIGQSAIDVFCPSFTMDHIEREFFFETIQTPWSGTLEYFKEQIYLGREEYISFDIFDTLVQRAFYRPEDLLELLNPKFRELTGSQVSFSKLRKSGEVFAREQHYRDFPKDQDVTLSEIYQQIAKSYQIDDSVIAAMQQEEILLEIRFAQIRQAGKALYEFAKYAGKKILLVSDMYLEMPVIKEILQKNGYAGYASIYLSSCSRKLKYTGDLFREVLRDYPDAENNMIHVGDTWTSDIAGSEKAGLRSLFLPKPIEQFENKIQGYTTNCCASMGEHVAGTILEGRKLTDNLGMGSMKAIVAQRYFDYPYRPFRAKSDFNADPYFIGYYALGMHMMGLCKWIHREVTRRGCKTIHFLARDGFLPMKAYEIYARYTEANLQLSYLHTSRKALLPMIAKEKTNFYQLPVEYRAHTPKSLLALLEFASKPMSLEEKWRILNKAGIKPDEHIAGESEYCRLIQCFLENIYSEEKHNSAKKTVEKYFAKIQPGDITFDMGYSGRIQSAISDACHRGVDTLFLHEDYKASVNMKAYGKFDIASFFDFRPAVTGLFREHLLSGCSGSCIGYQEKAEGVIPVIEAFEKSPTELFVIQSMQNGALDFVEDYMKQFGQFLEHMDYATFEVSLPFEEFLRHPTKMDLQIFNASGFEDEVYGAQKQINIEQFIRSQTDRLDRAMRVDDAANARPGGELYAVTSLSEQTFQEVLQQKPKLIRAILWFFADPREFKNKIVNHINRYLRKKR